MAICPLSAHFFSGCGHAETLDFTGFAGFVARCPLFFSISLKNLKIFIIVNIRKKYKELTKKSGHLAIRQYLEVNADESG